VPVAKDDPGILKVYALVRQFFTEMLARYYHTSFQAVTHPVFGVLNRQTANLLFFHRCWYFTNWQNVVKPYGGSGAHLAPGGADCSSEDSTLGIRIGKKSKSDAPLTEAYDPSYGYVS